MSLLLYKLLLQRNKKTPPISKNPLLNLYRDRALVWTSADGRRTLIQDMDDVHLRNAYRMVFEGRWKRGNSAKEAPRWAAVLFEELLERKIKPY